MRNKSLKYRRLISDTFIFGVGNLGSKIILFFLVPLYTQFLTTAEYGTADLVFTVAQLIIPFVSLVIFDAELRFGLSSDFDTKSVFKSSLLVVLLGTFVTAMLIPLLGLYSTLAEWKWYIFLYIVLIMIGNIELNYLKLIEKNRAYVAISVLHTAVMATANVIFLAIFHLGVKGYLLATILGCLITVVFAFFAGNIKSVIKNGKLDRVLLKQMLCFSTPLILNNVSWWIIQSSDKIMIESMIGVAALGVYTAATKIPSLINMIISIFSQAWGISSVKEYESSNDNNFYSSVFNSYMVIVFGVSLAINMVVKPFMSIYVSESFRESWRYVPLLLTSATFSAVASFFGSLYGALKKSVNNMRSTLIAAITNIIINYILIRFIGTWGAIIGTVSAYLVLSFYRMIDVLRFIKFNPNWKLFIANIIIVLLQSTLVSLNYHIIFTSVISLLLFIILNRNTVINIVFFAGNLLRR